MFTNTKNLKGLVVRATDGELGTINQLYFEDETWAIRYFTVETGKWLDGKEVLLSPHSVLAADWQNRRLDVALTMKQVKDSPNIDTHRPVSRHHEIEYLGYYGYPSYWGGTDLWGSEMYPGGLVIPESFSAATIANHTAKEANDSHLRSTDAVATYAIEALDGEIGHVDDFIVEEKAWAIRYIEVATQNWWPGKKVLISPTWVERVSWSESKVYVALRRDEIRQCPEYTETTKISREHEGRLYAHYGRPPYWLRQSRHEAEALVTNAG